MNEENEWDHNIAAEVKEGPADCIWMTELKAVLKKTWKEVVREDCQARKLNKENAMDRCKWRKVIKEAR